MNAFVSITLILAVYIIYRLEIRGSKKKKEIEIAHRIDRIDDLLISIREEDFPEVIEILARGVEIDRADVNGDIPVFAGIMQNNPEILKALIDSGANLDCLDRFGQGLLHYLATHGDEEWARSVAQLLLRKKADVNLKNARGKTPLMISAENGKLKLMELLIQFSANLELKSKDGATALMWAINGRNIDAVKILVESGARIDAAQGLGLTAIKAARLTGNNEIYEYLIEHSSETYADIAKKMR